jgi:hypothetical protein
MWGNLSLLGYGRESLISELNDVEYPAFAWAESIGDGKENRSNYFAYVQMPLNYITFHTSVLMMFQTKNNSSRLILVTLKWMERLTLLFLANWESTFKEMYKSYSNSRNWLCQRYKTNWTRVVGSPEAFKRSCDRCLNWFKWRLDNCMAWEIYEHCTNTLV